MQSESEPDATGQELLRLLKELPRDWRLRVIADLRAVARWPRWVDQAVGKPGRMNITLEQEQKLLPVLTRLFDAAFRMGYYKFKDAARFVLQRIRAELGDDVADEITLDHLQAAYIGMSGRYRDEGADSKGDVISVQSKDELEPRQVADDPPAYGCCPKASRNGCKCTKHGAT